jgi:hypothetical protein
MATVHIAPNTASAASIRAALAADGNVAEVVAHRDDLSCGPIDLGDDRRAWWTATLTGDMGRSWLSTWNSVEMDQPQYGVIDPAARMIVWVGRRSAQEFATYLSLTDQESPRPMHVIDVTDADPTYESTDSGAVAGLSPAAVAAYLGSERLLDTDERSRLAQRWSILRTENAPYRVVSPTAGLVSAPIDHFDSALLGELSTEPRPMTAVIAGVIGAHPFQTSDYVLQQRLIALIDAGTVSAEGNPATARTCLIRRTSR